MATSGVSGVALRAYTRLAPVGRPVAIACLAVGYVAIGVGVLAPDLLNSLRGGVPELLLVRVGYLVTFAYPAGFVGLALVAAAGAVTDRIGSAGLCRRDRIHAYLAIAFADWTLHHLLYLQFPLALSWGFLSLSMGAAYAVPVWGLLGVAVVGILVGNRYLWYHDPDDLPAGTLR